jgi:hypothetical protein
MEKERRVLDILVFSVSLIQETTFASFDVEKVARPTKIYDEEFSIVDRDSIMNQLETYHFSNCLLHNVSCLFFKCEVTSCVFGLLLPYAMICVFVVRECGAFVNMVPFWFVFLSKFAPPMIFHGFDTSCCHFNNIHWEPHKAMQGHPATPCRAPWQCTFGGLILLRKPPCQLHGQLWHLATLHHHLQTIKH